MQWAYLHYNNIWYDGRNAVKPVTSDVHGATILKYCQPKFGTDYVNSRINYEFHYPLGSWYKILN